MGRTPISMWYRTSDGNDYFRFSFEQQPDGSWRAYIVEMPDYDTRDDYISVTHRLSDDDRYYVCWSAALYSVDDCRVVAARWADLTSVYLHTGKTINEQAAGR